MLLGTVAPQGECGSRSNNLGELNSAGPKMGRDRK
jgi:hypothetical protein